MGIPESWRFDPWIWGIEPLKSDTERGDEFNGANARRVWGGNVSTGFSALTVAPLIPERHLLLEWNNHPLRQVSPHTVSRIPPTSIRTAKPNM